MTSTFEIKVETIPSGELVVTMIIDGKPFGDDCVDLGQLRKSAIISGAYDLQTCGCGEPGCAGFFEPIFVQHEGNVIRWEFDSHYHPVPRKDENEDDALTVVRYEFNRTQYITEVQEKFEWLRRQPNRNKLGPYGFDAAILEESFPDPDLPQCPVPEGAKVVVGYTNEFHQPWVWVEDFPDIYPRQLLPTGAMWSSFGAWSLMWDSLHFEYGQCIYRKDSAAYALREDVTVSECNRKAEEIASEIQRYWGGSINVAWDKVEEESRINFSRLQAGDVG